MIETNQLRCFIAVAEELHFNRAAQRLNMTQPPLSRQIQLLETRMDCKLFIRTSRSVEMTEAGKSFLTDARRILRLLENAEHSARDISAGRRGILRCGFTAATAYKFLPTLISRMETCIPNATLDLKEMVSSRQIAALDSGELDIGLLRAPIDPKKFQSKLATREKLVLAVPAGHPLSAHKFARWRDLDGIDFIMNDHIDAKYFHDILAVSFARKHVQPNIMQRLTQIHSMLSLVRANVGVAIVPESARILDVAGVEYREFSDQTSPFAELLVVWRETNQNPLIPNVVEIASEPLKSTLG